MSRYLSWQTDASALTATRSSTNDGEQAIHSQTLAVFLADILEAQPEWFAEGISEFALIARLQAEPLCLFEKDALREPLVLFQTHFIVFHALYEVRDRWRQRGIGELSIHTLRIALHPPVSASDTPAPPDPLRDYYLNWDNYTDTGHDEVAALLDDFWQRLGADPASGRVSPAAVSQARQELELGDETALSLQQVKRQYRRLVHRHHPDKGGDEARAKRLVHAYSVLTAHLR